MGQALYRFQFLFHRLASLLVAHSFCRGNSSGKFSPITFKPSIHVHPCPCKYYRCLISRLMGEDSSFYSPRGMQYLISSTHIDCGMRNLIYAIVINGEIRYVGLTTQELWRRIYQHLTKTYKQIRSGIDQGKRSIADELAACFENSSALTDSLKKKAFVEILGDAGVTIYPLAWFSGSPDTPKEKVTTILAAAESQLIDKFGTYEPMITFVSHLSPFPSNYFPHSIFISFLCIFSSLRTHLYPVPECMHENANVRREHRARGKAIVCGPSNALLD